MAQNNVKRHRGHYITWAAGWFWSYRTVTTVTHEGSGFVYPSARVMAFGWVWHIQACYSRLITSGVSWSWNVSSCATSSTLAGESYQMMTAFLQLLCGVGYFVKKLSYTTIWHQMRLILPLYGKPVFFFFLCFGHCHPFCPWHYQMLALRSNLERSFTSYWPLNVTFLFFRH